MEDLRSGIEHLKQAKAHMSEANGIMSGHISKLKALEEENAELRVALLPEVRGGGGLMTPEEEYDRMVSTSIAPARHACTASPIQSGTRAGLPRRLCPM